MMNKQVLLYCFMTVPFLLSKGFMVAMNFKTLYDVSRLAAGFIIVNMYLFSRKRKFNLLDLLFITYEGFLLMNTYAHGVSIIVSMRNPYIFNNILVFMLYQIGFDDTKNFIRAQYYSFSLVVYINLLTVFMFPDGIWVADSSGSSKNWFLGYYNMHSTVYVMAIYIALIYSLAYKKFLGPLLMISAIYTSAVILQSGGTLAMLMVTGVLLIFYRKGKIFVDYWALWTVPIIFFIGIIIFQASSWGNYVYSLSEAAFSKGASFLGRARAWVWGVYYFQRSPFFGYGIIHTTNYGAESWAVHGHNLMLEILHQGGLASLSLFAALVVTSGRRLRHLKSQKLYCATLVAFAGWIINTLVEIYMTPFLMSLFVVAFRAPSVDRFLQERAETQSVTLRHVKFSRHKPLQPVPAEN